jgi:acetate kinase
MLDKGLTGGARARRSAAERERAMDSLILTLNAGSSSLKFSVFDAGDLPAGALAAGQVEALTTTPRLKARQRTAGGDLVHDRALTSAVTHAEAVRALLRWMFDAYPQSRLKAIGHRVVHGGIQYASPVIVDDTVLVSLRRLERLAPLHQPHNLAGIEAAREAFPSASQVACFDTAFHRGHPFVSDAFAIPRSLYDEGVRRYGFHGLSYEFVVRQLREVAPADARGNVVIAHLGNGASMCAVRNGVSLASTMGFTALDGLPMGTRCGQLDPGVLLYLMTERGMSAGDLTELLYKQSGLKGLSGVSSDMRDLERSEDPRARDAIAYFVARIRHELGGLAVQLGGLDAIVFTAGIGENSARLREAVLQDLDWLGIELDRAANVSGGPLISTQESPVRAYVLRTDEERMIAEHTLAVMQSPRPPVLSA